MFPVGSKHVRFGNPNFVVTVTDVNGFFVSFRLPSGQETYCSRHAFAASFKPAEYTYY